MKRLEPPLVAALVRARRPDIDALRVLAIGVVFVVHCAMVFSPLQYWRVQNAERAAWLGQLTLLAWPWVMPLFMLLGGAGAWFSLSKRSNGSYLKERTVRLALPVVVGTFLLMPPQIWIERLQQGRFSGSLWAFLPRFVDGFYPDGNLSAGHLWFIAYLYVYAVVTLPLLRWLRSDTGQRWIDQAVGAVRTPLRLVLLPAIPIAVTQVAFRDRFPDTLALVNDWSNHGVLVLAYLYGFVLMARPALEARIHDEWRSALPFAVVGTLWITWAVWTSTEPGFLPRGYTRSYVSFWTAFSVAGWAWIVVLLGGAHKVMKRRGTALTWAAEGVFLFYVLHQTVIVLVAYPVVGWDLALTVKFATIVGLSLGVTLVLVEGARLWPPTRILFGLRRG